MKIQGHAILAPSFVLHELNLGFELSHPFGEVGVCPLEGLPRLTGSKLTGIQMISHSFSVASERAGLVGAPPYRCLGGALPSNVAEEASPDGTPYGIWDTAMWQEGQA